MGVSITDWEIHFKQLSPEFRAEVIKAIETLQKDEMIFEEYEWTLLFTLAKIARGVAVTPKLLTVLKGLEDEHGEDIPLIAIYEEAEKEGLSRDDVDKKVQILKRDGLLFSPDKATVRFVR